MVALFKLAMCEWFCQCIVTRHCVWSSVWWCCVCAQWNYFNGSASMRSIYTIVYIWCNSEVCGGCWYCVYSIIMVVLSERWWYCALRLVRVGEYIPVAYLASTDQLVGSVVGVNQELISTLYTPRWMDSCIMWYQLYLYDSVCTCVSLLILII